MSSDLDLEQQFPVLLRHLRTGDGVERANALAALGAFVASERKRSLRLLIERLRGGDAAARLDALGALEALGRQARPAVLLVLAHLADTDEDVAHRAFRCLERVAPEVLEQSRLLSSASRQDR